MTAAILFIYPVWGVVENRLGGSAHLPDGVSTLLELERVIAAAVFDLPATDVNEVAEKEDPVSPMSAALMTLVTLSLPGALFWFRRARHAED